MKPVQRVSRTLLRTVVWRLHCK